MLWNRLGASIKRFLESIPRGPSSPFYSFFGKMPHKKTSLKTQRRVPLGYFSKNLTPSCKDKNDRLESIKVNIKSPCHSGLATGARFI